MLIQLLLLLVIGYINSSDMDRLKYLCNYSHDLISSTGTIYLTFLLAFQNYQKQKNLVCRANWTGARSFQKKKKKEKGKKKPSSPSLTPLYFFKRDQLLHFFLRSQSTPARARINLSTLPPPSSLPLPSSLYTVHDPYTRATTNFRSKFISAAMVLIGLDTAAEFSRFKGDKGRWLRAWHKKPRPPLWKTKQTGAQGEGERDANRRTNGRAGQDKSNIGVIRS